VYKERLLSKPCLPAFTDCIDHGVCEIDRRIIAPSVFTSLGIIKCPGLVQSTVAACGTGVFLRDSCPRCGKPVRDASQRFRLRVSNPTKELQQCVYCERSLLDCENPELANDQTVKLTKILDLLVRNPDCGGFFAVLDRLLRTMCSQSAFAFQLRSRLLPNLRIESRRRGATLGDFSFLKVKSRALMIQAVVSLFAHWPDNLLDVIRMSPRYIHHLMYPWRPRRDHVFRDDRGLPAWYANPCDLPLWYLKAIWVAHKRDRKPKKSDKAAFHRAARREGWISVVQFADSLC